MVPVELVAEVTRGHCARVYRVRQNCSERFGNKDLIWVTVTYAD